MPTCCVDPDTMANNVVCDAEEWVAAAAEVTTAGAVVFSPSLCFFLSLHQALMGGVAVNAPPW